MSNKDSLGDRMKKYEAAFKPHLPERMPIIIRVDGKGFHSYTKGCKRPFDENLVNCMNETAKYLCENIQGAKLAFIQSDEISILVTNYETVNTQSWFDNSLIKMVSISAAMASAKFTSISHTIFGKTKIATFDSRVFIVPENDVCNSLLWRQQDATRNSVQMLARTLYSHKECNNKNNSQLQEMCFQKGHNWNDCPTQQKRGRCIIKSEFIKDLDSQDMANNPHLPAGPVVRKKWVIDNEIPIFSENRDYINKLL
jgi:tRNA(His) 5'-end guanylyltransferase